MAQAVWELSVDLKTKTATFQSGMSDAARSAKNAFTDIRQGSEGMSDGVSYNMTEARHGVMLLGEEFGVHMPRALVSFISQLGPVSAAMEAAFPFLAILVGATLLIEHLAKLKEAGEKLTESQIAFGTAATNALNGLDTKLLNAGIKADELNQNHLAALHKQLELIDRQSMAELVQTFGTLAKAADEVFKQLDRHWYQFGSGSEAAKGSLDRFKSEYDSLLAKKDNAGATKLLDETVSREEKILALQKQRNDSQADPGHGKNGDYAKFEEASLALKKLGVSYDKDAVASQEILVRALQDQVEAQKIINETKSVEKKNTTTGTDNKIGAEQDKAFRKMAEDQKRADEDAQKQWEANYKRAVSDLQEAERMKIDATHKGSAERLQAIDAAIKEEESKGLQAEGFYKGLRHERADLQQSMDGEEKKLRAEAGRQEAEHTLKMGELVLAADREHANLRTVLALQTGAQRLAIEKAFAATDYQQKLEALQKEESALDKDGSEYQNKLKALQNKELELRKAHENKVQQLEDQAAQQRFSKLTADQQRMAGIYAQGFTQVLMGHQSFAKMMAQTGNQVVSSMLQNAIQSAIAMDFGKEKEAAAAARKMYLAGTHFPFPTNIVMAPLLGALGFASMMAFAEGGIVPGVGRGDTVPAMLTPGEAVLPKRLTENLSKSTAASSGDTYHVHHNPTYHVNTIDAAGVRGMLDKHGDEFVQHTERTLRKMNK